MKRILLFCVFLISLSLFTYQVALTRIYSAILSYHYVFLTTSFAILGVGIGSILAYRGWSQRGKNYISDQVTVENVTAHVNKGAFMLSCGFIVAFVLIYVQPFIDNLMIYIVLGIFPFIASGYLFAALYKMVPQVSGKLYFSDLTGAGAGSIAIVSLLDFIGMLKTAALICLLPLIAAVFLPAAGKKLRIIQYILPGMLAAVLFLPMQTAGSVETGFYALLNNSDKTYGEAQRNGLSPEIVFSEWDSFARTDLIELAPYPEMKILTIDGSANSPMYEFDGNTSDMDRFTQNTGFVPFAIGDSNSALVIGAGGGRGILYALAAGCWDITAVEINPASIYAARKFGDFNGNLFDRPEVKTFIQDGRNFVRTTDETFDVIFLSLVVTNTAQRIGFALSENFIYTVEAMEDYLDRLTYKGNVAYVAHDQPSINRLLTTAVQALVNRGIPLQQTPDHIALFYQVTEVSQGIGQMLAPAIIVRNQPFDESESLELERGISRINAVPGHIPHLQESDVMSAVKNGGSTFKQLVDSFDDRVTPVTDNSPYFFNFNRGVPGVLLLILVFSLTGVLLLTVPFFRKKKNLKPSVYFGLLGMGFMMIQVPLIQRFILYLGHPTLAFSYVLAAMLIGCGIGGYAGSSGFFRKKTGRVYFPPVVAAFFVLILLLSLSFIFRGTAGWGIAGKVAVSSAAVMIPGFFMGMPFPRGLALLGESSRNDMIPVMWGINGITSVTGSVLSIILSMTLGLPAALITGVIIYIAVGFFDEM